MGGPKSLGGYVPSDAQDTRKQKRWKDQPYSLHREPGPGCLDFGLLDSRTVSGPMSGAQPPSLRSLSQDPGHHTRSSPCTVRSAVVRTLLKLLIIFSIGYARPRLRQTRAPWR